MVEEFATEDPTGLVVPAEVHPQPPEVAAAMARRVGPGPAPRGTAGVTTCGSLAVLGAPGFGLLWWDPRRDRLLEGWDLRGCRALALSPNGAHLALVREPGQVELWDRARRRPRLVFRAGPAKEGWRLAFSPDSARLYARTGTNYTSHLHALATGGGEYLYGRTMPAGALTSFPDPSGDLLVLRRRRGGLHVVDHHAARQVLEVAMDPEHSEGWVVGASESCFAPGGQALVTRTNWNHLWHVDLRHHRTRPLVKLPGQWGRVGFLEQGARVLAAVQADRSPRVGELLVMDPQTGRVEARREVPHAAAGAVHPVGASSLAILVRDACAVVDHATGETRRTLPLAWRAGGDIPPPALDGVPVVEPDPARQRALYMPDDEDGSVWGDQIGPGYRSPAGSRRWRDPPAGHEPIDPGQAPCLEAGRGSVRLREAGGAGVA